MNDEKQEKLLILATHGPEDSERATFPFVMANASLVMDVPATVVLQGYAVVLAQKGVAGHVFAGGLPPLKDLLDSFFAQDGKLLVCTPCLKERRIDSGMLIEGAEMVAAARVVMETLGATSTLSY